MSGEEYKIIDGDLYKLVELGAGQLYEGAPCPLCHAQGTVIRHKQQGFAARYGCKSCGAWLNGVALNGFPTGGTPHKHDV